MTAFVVTTFDDVANGDVSENDLSLREAIALANARPGGDRITFADTIDYVALTDELPTISDSLRLVGGRNVVLDANADGDFDPATTADEGNRRALDIGGGDIAVTIDGLTITGGSTSSGGGGIRSARNVDLTLVDGRIAANRDHGDAGGGILADGNLTLRRSVVADNISTGEGGGIAVRFGEARIVHSRIEGNEANRGGGIEAHHLTMLHSQVAMNRAVSGGGGIAAYDATLLTASCGMVES
jgi:hypothetical protein